MAGTVYISKAFSDYWAKEQKENMENGFRKTLMYKALRDQGKNDKDALSEIASIWLKVIESDPKGFKKIIGEGLRIKALSLQPTRSNYE